MSSGKQKRDCTVLHRAHVFPENRSVSTGAFKDLDNHVFQTYQISPLITSTEEAVFLLAFDWGGVGWGVALSFFLLRNEGSFYHVGLQKSVTYQSLVRIRAAFLDRWSRISNIQGFWDICGE